MKKRTIAFGTLGCRLNQYESDSLVSQFKNNGYEVVPFNESADVYIVNTCTVTNKSDAKSRYMINKLHRQNKSSAIFVTGCYAETDAETIEKIDGVNFVVSNTKKHSLFSIVEQALNNKTIDWDSIEDNRFDYDSGEDTLHTRAYLKIQDGCDENCSYCKIPAARGQAESRSFEETISEFRKLVSSGFKEIIFTGINIGDYSYNNKKLYDVISACLNVEGDFRIHISSIEPNKVTEELVSLFSNDKMVKHFHLPLQSGSDKILSLMNRNYTSAHFENTIQKILQAVSNMQITSDLMVGFPGETENDFQQSFEILKRNNVAKIHTFKYSKRDGTPASEMLNQVDDKTKSLRSEEIRDLSERNSQAYRRKHIGRESNILIEKEIDNNIYAGYDDYYIRVQIESANKLEIGEMVRVKTYDILENCNVARLLSFK